MNFILKLFSPKKVECPRCLGKGKVDLDDIKRLNQELSWIPDTCAYCNGKGIVPANLISKVAADSSYLTTDIPKAERKRFLKNDEGAKARAEFLKIQREDFIAQVEYLYFVGNLSPSKIIDFYQLNLNQSEIDPNEENELREYIKKIIKLKQENQTS